MDFTVLLVDDDRNLLHSLTRALRQQPYRILTAQDADEAIHILKTQRIDLIVTDECMPGLPGTVFLAWAAEEFPDITRIVLTGQANVGAAIRAINQSKVFRFLTKPCDPYALAMAIHDGLEHARKRGPCDAIECPRGNAVT